MHITDTGTIYSYFAEKYMSNATVFKLFCESSVWTVISKQLLPNASDFWITFGSSSKWGVSYYLSLIKLKVKFKLSHILCLAAYFFKNICIEIEIICKKRECATSHVVNIVIKKNHFFKYNLNAHQQII